MIINKIKNKKPHIIIISNTITNIINNKIIIKKIINKNNKIVSNRVINYPVILYQN
jgi:hypothetical protein